ncbi:MAG: DMT family transporter [Alphaproteobacteria bacterium]|nr:DMT family transporter [Alphaproteobacteria bacterium SS10]
MTEHVANHPALAPLACVVTVLAWASAFPLITHGLAVLDPLPLAACRFFVAGVVVGLWLVWAKPKRPTVPDLARFALCGLIGIGVYNALLNIGQQTVSAGASSFIINTAPVMTAVLATLFLGERFARWAWVGTLISLGGIAVIAMGQPGGLTLGGGASLILGSAGCAAIYFTIQRPMVARYGFLACAAYTLLSGGIFLLPWLPAGVSSLAADAWSISIVMAIVHLGVISAALGYATWTYVLGTYGAARAANLLYTVPPTAVLLSILLLGHRPDVLTLLGGAIALFGVVVVQRAQARATIRSAQN